MVIAPCLVEGGKAEEQSAIGYKVIDIVSQPSGPAVVRELIEELCQWVVLLTLSYLLDGCLAYIVEELGGFGVGEAATQCPQERTCEDTAVQAVP